VTTPARFFVYAYITEKSHTKKFIYFLDRGCSLIVCGFQVKDRSVIETTDAERRTTAPAGLQAAVDELVAKYAPSGRSFVRCVDDDDGVLCSYRAVEFGFEKT